MPVAIVKCPCDYLSITDPKCDAVQSLGPINITKLQTVSQPNNCNMPLPLQIYTGISYSGRDTLPLLSLMAFIHCTVYVIVKSGILRCNVTKPFSSLCGFHVTEPFSVIVHSHVTKPLC